MLSLKIMIENETEGCSRQLNVQREFPGGPVRTQYFHCSNSVQSLVGELRSHKLLSAATKKKVK